MNNNQLAEALRLAIERIKDLLPADDGQAWKEAERALPRLEATLAAYEESTHQSNASKTSDGIDMPQQAAPVEPVQKPKWSEGVTDDQIEAVHRNLGIGIPDHRAASIVRAVLKASAPKPEPVEPVAWQRRMFLGGKWDEWTACEPLDDGESMDYTYPDSRVRHQFRKLYAHPAAPKPEQFAPDWDQVEALRASLREHQQIIRDLKAAAPKPLTPEQMKALMREAGYTGAPAQAKADFIAGVRHGEQAHGIKEQA